MKRPCVALAAGLSASVTLLAQPSPPSGLRGSAADALDQKTTLVIERQPIARALDDISRHTGVPVRMAPRTAELLIFGPETVVSIRMSDVPLREGLTGMVRPIGMTLAVVPEAIEIVPLPALRRLGRRPTRDELALLEQLVRSEWSAAAALTLPLEFRVPSAEARQQWLAAAKGLPNNTPSQADALEATCERLGWTWFPNDDRLVVVTRAQQIQRQLDRLVTVRFVRENVSRIVEQLAERADLSIVIEPEAATRLHNDLRDHVSLIATGVSIREAIGQLAAATGLEYRVESNGVALRTGAGLVARQADPPADRIIATLTVPIEGGEVQIPIRVSDCPPELKAWLEARKQTGLEALLRQIQPEP